MVYPSYARLHKLVATSTCFSPGESSHHFEESIKVSNSRQVTQGKLAVQNNPLFSCSYQDLLPQDIVPLVGALYEVITLSRMKSPSLQINPEVRSLQDLLLF